MYKNLYKKYIEKYKNNKTLLKYNNQYCIECIQYY
jgi:hypothetical protein